MERCMGEGIKKMSFKKDFILLFKPYYLVNILLSLSYLAAKKIPFICNILFSSTSSQCELDSVSTEVSNYRT
jgi:hypothetical protein